MSPVPKVLADPKLPNVSRPDTFSPSTSRAALNVMLLLEFCHTVRGTPLGVLILPPADATVVLWLGEALRRKPPDRIVMSFTPRASVAPVLFVVQRNEFIVVLTVRVVRVLVNWVTFDVPVAPTKPTYDVN